MASHYAFESITLDTFNEVVDQYQHVVPEKLADLEEQRFQIIPSTLTERISEGVFHLTKDEVVTLVDWKL